MARLAVGFQGLWARARAHEEGVEAENELSVAVEELEHAVDHAGRVDALRLELLHDVKELRERTTAHACAACGVHTTSNSPSCGRHAEWPSLLWHVRRSATRVARRAAACGVKSARLVVDVRLLLELHLDLIQIRQCCAGAQARAETARANAAACRCNAKTTSDGAECVGRSARRACIRRALARACVCSAEGWSGVGPRRDAPSSTLSCR
jgi:hypothetical protein